MLENGKKIKLTDLIDIEFLQEFQDFFAKTMGVASIAVDDNGPITKPSNFTPFCNKYTRGSKEGYRRCNECDIRWGKVAAKSGKPTIYTCHSGLTDFAVPIMIGGEHVASILGGQVLTEPPNEEHFRALARELGIDEDEYLDAVKQIKIVPAATVDAAANFLYLVANAISKIAYKNFELMKKSERESIYRNIIDTIRSSLDISETKQIIVDIIGKTLDTDRCFITEYDKATDKFLVVQDEYLSSNNILGYKGTDSNKTVPAFVEAYKKGKPLLIKNKEIFLDAENQTFDIEKEAIEKYDVNSAFSFPLFYHDEFLGVLSIHYVNKEHEISEDETNLITMIGNQIAIALHQAKLYKLTQVDAKRESLLRNIIETIRSSLDIEETLSFICEETAKLFNVQRTAITVFPCPENFEEFIIRKEYETSPEIQGLMQIENPSKIAAYWGNILIKSGEVVAIDNIKESDEPDYFKNAYESIGTKSILGMSIRKGKKVWGTLVLSEYNNYRHWTNEEKTLLKTISDQVYIAINQAELYEQEQKQSQREQFGRSIIEILRNTIDKNIVKHLFVRSIAKNFNADRVFFSDFDSKNNIYLPIDENSEFRSSLEEKSFVNQNWSDDSMSEYIQPLIEKRELKIACWEEYIKKNLISEDFKSRFEDSNVKSSYNFPVLYEGTLMGFFCIEFTHEGCRKLSDEDISSIRNICTQAGIALYHAELYRKEKEAAERERILREVINKIRGSLDIEDIKYEIVNQIGTLFKADRVVIAYYDKILKIYTISEKGEYRSYGCEKSFVGVRFDNIEGFSEYIRDAHLRGEDIIFSDLESHLDNNNLRGTGVENFYREFGFISSMALNIVYGDIFLGDLVITFEQKRIFSGDEINFIRTIADQAGTAFYQAELLEKEKQTAKRESLLRKIIEIIRNSLDINEIKRNVVNEIGKAFNADRCYFRYYDKNQDKFLTPDVEYLLSNEIPSLLNEVPNQEGLAYFIEELNKRKKGFYPIVADEKFAKGTPLEAYFKSTGLKADYAMPILDKEEELTYLVLHYTKKDPNLSEEDKRLLETIANQIVIALDQAKLFEKEKQTAERESLLRSVTEAIRNSLDINEIKRKITLEIGKALNADRCVIMQYDSAKRSFLEVDEYSQYVINDEIGSHKGLNLEHEDLNAFKDLFLNQRKELLLSDVEAPPEFIDQNILNKLKELNIKSNYTVLITYGDQFLGILYINYIKQKRNFSKEEIELFRSLASQSAIALNQAELYGKEKHTAEKETLLREILGDIKLTQSIDQAYNYLITKLSNVFGVSGVIFIEIPDLKYEKPRVKYEYIRNNELPTFQDSEFPDACSDMFSELAKSINPLIINDSTNLHADNESAQKFCSEHTIKSFMALPLVNSRNSKKAMGIIVICSSELRTWSNEEIDLLSSITTSAVAILLEIIKLNEIDELINTFILTLSKGVQIPLGIQEKTLEILASQNENQPIGKFKAAIIETLESNKNLFELLTKLLDSYNYESGKKKLNLERCNMVDIINNVKNDLNELAESKSMTINVNIDKNIPEIAIDKDEIGKVIYSLLENAINYTQNKGIIEIKSYKIVEDIVTCISDNGPGMSSEMKERIFQRYAVAQIIDKKVGSGMGLYLSKLVAEAHGGKIWCESDVGVGTIVCFLLPAHQE